MLLLSVDWDFFFPNPLDGGKCSGEEALLYDWGHRESRFFVETIWPIRAAGFERAGRPLPVVEEGWRSFWSRFTFAPRVKLFVAESHSFAADRRVKRGVTGVLNFDAHHDCGYSERWPAELDCGNWMLAYDCPKQVRYPRWRVGAEGKPLVPVDLVKDDGSPIRAPIGRVFVCRSGAWVPPWCDTDFECFVQLAGLPVVDIGKFERSWTGPAEIPALPVAVAS